MTYDKIIRVGLDFINRTHREAKPHNFLSSSRVGREGRLHFPSLGEFWLLIGEFAPWLVAR